MLALVNLKDSSAVAIGTIKFPVSAPDLHFHNLITGFVKLLHLILQWWNVSVLSKPSFWPDKSENTKKQTLQKTKLRGIFLSPLFCWSVLNKQRLTKLGFEIECWRSLSNKYFKDLIQIVSVVRNVWLLPIPPAVKTFPSVKLTEI